MSNITVIQTLTIITPADIPAPKFAFNQRVRCTQNHPKIVCGVIRGLEYIDAEVAKQEGFEQGWSYTVRLDNNHRFWQMHSIIVCSESSLVEA